MIPTIRPDDFYDSPISIQIVNVKHYPAQIHPSEMEIILCLSGKATVVTAHDSLIITQNQILTIDAEDIHCIYSDEDNVLAIINLDLTKSNEYDWEDLRYRYISTFTWMDRPYTKQYLTQVHRILMAMIYAYATDTRHTDEQLQQIYEDLLEILVEEFSWPYKNDVDFDVNEEVKERLNSINAYVQKNYNRKITAKEISSQYNINQNYFSQFMKNTSYKGFKEMLAYIRCYKAEHMMLDSELSAEQISAMCGFSSSKYFYRWFRHYWRRTPMQHRKWYRDYTNKPDDFYEFSPKETLPIIEHYIAETTTSLVFEEIDQNSSFIPMHE